MSEQEQWRVGHEVVDRGEIDPDRDLSTDDIDRIVSEVRVAVGGRPSLTAPGVKSPALNVRLPASMRSELDAVAAEQGKRPSEVAREAVAEYLAKR